MIDKETIEQRYNGTKGQRNKRTIGQKVTIEKWDNGTKGQRDYGTMGQ